MAQQHLKGNHIEYLRSCEGKTPFLSQHAAERNRYENGVSADKYESYKCQFCNRWHIGHGRGIPRFASEHAPVIKPQKRKKK